jgi:hypothetical protein
MSKMMLVLLWMFLMLHGCGQRPQECRDVVDVPREQGYAKFRSYPLEKQLDVYLCAMHLEPPDMGLADEIAERGDTAIPTVMQKLKTADREIDQEDLIYLFEVMSDRGLLRGRQDVIQDIARVIDNMKITQLKQRSKERLKKIEIANGMKSLIDAQSHDNLRAAAI